jgi:hypothetical protein
MSLPNYMGCLMEFCKSVSLYYTKMCFNILNFFRRTQSLSREIYFKYHHKSPYPGDSKYSAENDSSGILKYCHEHKLNIPLLLHDHKLLYTSQLR